MRKVLNSRIFKIIYNDRYKLFDNGILFVNNKIHFHIEVVFFLN